MRRFNNLTAFLLLSTALLAPAQFLTFAKAGVPVSQTKVGDNSYFKPRAYSRKPSKDALAWANRELQRMSLDEKIGQLLSVGINATFLNQDSDAYAALKHQIADNHVGGIILFRGPVYESVVLVNRMHHLSRYPLLISADLEAGAGMRFDDTVNFPWNMAVATTGHFGKPPPQSEGTAPE